MPKVKKEPIPMHLIVPDTNILWDKDKKKAVNQDFNEFWERNLKLIPISLLLPEVVLGELVFQQATSAMKVASYIYEQSEELSGITKSKYTKKYSDDLIKNQVEKKLNKWLQSLNGKIEKTPISTIQWSNLISDAIWRRSPFTYDPKDKDNEKGFRDSLIFETLKQICIQRKSESVNVVFITNDYLLKTTASTYLADNPKVLIFESLKDFESYIKLTQEELTNNFVKSIQNHARSKFFVVDDKTTIYYSNEIRNLIADKYKEDLIPPNETNSLRGLLGISINKSFGVLSEHWWIRETNFERLNHPREYHWITQITLARLLGVAKETNDNNYPLLTPAENEVQLINFGIKWKANVKADGRFHDIKVIEVAKIDSTRERASDELIGRWKLHISRGS